MNLADRVKGLVANTRLSVDSRIATTLGVSIAEVKLVREQKFFDDVYYLKYNQDIDVKKVDPFLHFVVHGVYEGRNPNPFFSSSHYLNFLREEGIEGNPFGYFFNNQKSVGFSRGEKLENIVRILATRGNRFVCDVCRIEKAQIDKIILSGLFDFDFYNSQFDDVKDGPLDALVHYFCFGDIEGRPSSYKFNAFDYRNKHSIPVTALAIVDCLSQPNFEKEFEQSLPTSLKVVNPVTTDIDTGISADWISPTQLQIHFFEGVLGYRFQINNASEQLTNLAEGERAVIPFVSPSNRLDDFKVRINWPVVAKDAILKVKVYSSLSENILHEYSEVYFSDIDNCWVNLNIGHRTYTEKRRYFVVLEFENASREELKIYAVPYSDEYFYEGKTHLVSPNVERSLPREFTVQNAAILIPAVFDLEEIEEALSSIVLFQDVDLIHCLSPDGRILETLCSYKSIGVLEPEKLGPINGIKSAADLPFILNQNGTDSFFISLEPTFDLLSYSLAKKNIYTTFQRGFTLIDGTLSTVDDLSYSKGTEYINGLLVPEQPNTLPHVAIISVVYKKAQMIASFLEVVQRQTYPGKITLVIVDDCSPDNSVDKLREYLTRKAKYLPENLSVKVIVNDVNSGNCFSRNHGIKEVEADIYSIIDCDCLLNSQYVEAHVREHLIAPTQVVIGPLNLETHGEDGETMLRRLEVSPEEVKQKMNMQDSIQLNGFVNCITRNFSITKAWLKENECFDLDFSYSAKPGSGFGWEDVEFGSRIYTSGAHIRYTYNAISLHQSHPTSVAEENQIIGSAKNFNLLFDRHPDVKLAARRWATDTAQKIVAWADSKDVDHQYITSLKRNFAKPSRDIDSLIKALNNKQRRLKILQYRWHVPHQYEIHKLPHDFTLVTDTGTGFTNGWSFEQRNMRENVRMLSRSQIRPQEYDAAIVHFDENVLCSDLSNGVLGPDWGRSFKWFMANLKELPKVAICHGTPPFVGQYCANPKEVSEFEIYEEERIRLVELLKDTLVICNSHQAQREWGFKQSKVIWHGLDPQEIPPGKHRHDVVSHGVDWHRPHYRGAHAAERVIDGLSTHNINVVNHAHVGARGLPIDNFRFAAASYRAWIDHVGNHKVYLNTTLRSPMPRSRTEAMMSGTIPVSLRTHDVDCFIRNGIDGFYSHDEQELIDFIRFVCSDDKAFRKISQQARLTAMRTFNNDRFLTEWTDLLTSIVGSRGN